MSVHYSRRRILNQGIALTTSLSAIRLASAQVLLDEALADATPGQILGPVYPVDKPDDQDADLTRTRGRDGAAEGQVIHMSCRVVDLAGAPVRRARIELWQANTHGRYTHPADVNPAPLDPNFEGYAALRTDGDGHFSFKTVKPGAYPASEDNIRPPHIHFDIAGKQTRLVTQLYFPDEPLNDTDDAFLTVPEEQRDALIASPMPLEEGMAADELHFGWEIRLAAG
jgi:protocatechuate 3,4-dioxygenase beta subunit